MRYIIYILGALMLCGCFGIGTEDNPERKLPEKPLPLGKQLLHLATSDAPITPKEYDQRIAELDGLLVEAKSAKQLAQHQARDAELRAWRTYTAWISVVAIPLAIAGAVLSLWLGFARLGLPLAASIISAALGLQLWAEAQAYLLIALIALAALAIIVVGYVLWRNRRALYATAKIADALERDNSCEIDRAKLLAHREQLSAGVFYALQKARGKLGKKITPAQVTP